MRAVVLRASCKLLLNPKVRSNPKCDSWLSLCMLWARRIHASAHISNGHVSFDPTLNYGVWWNWMVLRGTRDSMAWRWNASTSLIRDVYLSLAKVLGKRYAHLVMQSLVQFSRPTWSGNPPSMIISWPKSIITSSTSVSEFTTKRQCMTKFLI